MKILYDLRDRSIDSFEQERARGKELFFWSAQNVSRRLLDSLEKHGRDELSQLGHMYFGTIAAGFQELDKEGRERLILPANGKRVYSDLIAAFVKDGKIWSGTWRTRPDPMVIVVPVFWTMVMKPLKSQERDLLWEAMELPQSRRADLTTWFQKHFRL